MDARTETLEVPGARLYYETRGSGPVLLLIPGGNGDAAPYGRVAGLLADRYTVVAYERRGFSRSPLDRPLGPADDGGRVATDADDADRLLAHLTDAPAYVFGSSSGAIVTLELAARAPERLRMVVPHEPPVVTLLPDAEELLAFLDSVHTTYRTSGVDRAMAEFARGTFGTDGPRGPNTPPPPEFAEAMARMQANQPFWMEHELRPYPRHPVDTAALRALGNRVVPACGRDSREQFPYRANAAVARLLDQPVVELPGGHVGYMTDSDAFAGELAEVLARA